MRSNLRRVLVAVVTVLALLVPTAAFADDWTGSGGTGGTSGSSGGCTSNCGTDTSYTCHADGSLWRNGVEYYLPGYPNCTRPGSSYTGTVMECPSGGLAYRFYGTTGGKVAAWTVSYVGLPYLCDTADHLYNFLAPNPVDDNAGAGPRVSPWWVRSGTNPTDLRTWVRSEKTLLTTGPVVRGGGDCSAFQTSPDPMVANFANFTSILQPALYNTWVTFSNGGAYPLTGLTYINGRQQRITGVKSIVYNDKISCSSPWDYSSPVASSSAAKVVGTCYIPLVRRGRQMRTPSGSTPWAWNNTTDGERFSTSYGNQTTAAAVSRDSSYPWHKAWRSLMYSDELRHGGPLQHYTNISSWTKPAPDTTTSPDWKAAAADLATYAICRDAPRVTAKVMQPPASCTAGSTSCPGVPNGTAGTVQVTLGDLKVFQVGGELRDASAGRLTATPGPLRGAPAGSYLTELRFHLHVAGRNGYQVCQLGSSGASCDGQVVAQTPYASPVQGSETLDARFFRASQPGQSVRVWVDDLYGVYKWPYQAPPVTMVVTNPDGTQTTYSYSPPAVWTSQVFTPTVVGTPVPVSGGGTAYYVDLPVIGAVNNPH